jgi:glutathione synthase/RimK-type ligase-like ATP-grasp enzyme
LLLDALRHAGLRAELLAWDNPHAAPGAFDLCVLRSCWNYHERPEAFLAWIESAAAASKLLNPANVVRWNLHKSYLRELDTAGVPIIPTVWFERGAAANLRTTMQARGWDEVVVKPAISAASYRTQRFRESDAVAGQEFLDALVRDRDAMVQRYIPSVEDLGERAVVWIAGKITHAVVKQSRFAGDDEHVSDAVEITDEESQIAQRAVACAGGELLYARVDLVQDNDAAVLVSELELIEPSLFLLQCPAALGRFVDAIRRERPRRS